MCTIFLLRTPTIAIWVYSINKNFVETFVHIRVARSLTQPLRFTPNPLVHMVLAFTLSGPQAIDQLIMRWDLPQTFLSQKNIHAVLDILPVFLTRDSIMQSALYTFAYTSVPMSARLPARTPSVCLAGGLVKTVEVRIVQFSPYRLRWHCSAFPR